MNLPPGKKVAAYGPCSSSSRTSLSVTRKPMRLASERMTFSLIRLSAARCAKNGISMFACAPPRGNCCWTICCACLRTSVVRTSSPATVATTPFLVAPAPNTDVPPPPGRTYQAMETQITNNMPAKKYFLNQLDVCMKRIMMKELQVSGKLDYKRMRGRDGACNVLLCAVMET